MRLIGYHPMLEATDLYVMEELLRRQYQNFPVPTKGSLSYGKSARSIAGPPGSGTANYAWKGPNLREGLAPSGNQRANSALDASGL